MVVICYGTRPEVIKVSSVIKELQKRNIPFKTVFTGQHKELFEDVRDLVPEPDFRLNIMRENQTLNHIVARIAEGLTDILQEIDAKVLLVQGDTSTALTSALVAFNMRIPVGHIEAGLRTFNLDSPFPEEANRQLISRIATFNWAPTELSAGYLKNENLKNVTVTGNTVVDMCHDLNYPVKFDDKVLITLHRRENFGERMENYFRQIEALAVKHPELKFIFPMHPNPNVQKHKHLLKHVEVTSPMSYFPFIKELSEAKCIITDSGGVQEEAGTFKKRILLCRDTTERMEGVHAGFVTMVENDLEAEFEKVLQNPQYDGVNPFGEGKAAQIIVDEIEARITF